MWLLRGRMIRVSIADQLLWRKRKIMTAEEADNVMRALRVKQGKGTNLRIDGRLLSAEETAQALVKGRELSRFPFIEKWASLVFQPNTTE
jgi:hypothetical protein